MSERGRGSNREFLLYWAGFLISVVSVIFLIMTVSGLLVNVLSMGCYYPYIGEMLGMSKSFPLAQSTNATMSANPQPPLNRTMTPEESTGVSIAYPTPYYYPCGNPIVAIIQFVFSLLSALAGVGAGLYMMMSGKKH